MSAATLTVRVACKWQEARDICGFEFVSDDGSPLPRFDAGAHIDVHLPGGLVRQYSLCNHPEHGDRYQIAVLRDADGRGGSRTIHDAVRQGDTVRIGVPRNQFPLAPTRRTTCCSQAGSASRRSSAWRNGCSRPAARSTCITARARPTAWPSSSGSTRPGSVIVPASTSTTARPSNASTWPPCSPRRPKHAPVRMRAARLHGCGVERRARARWAEARLHYEFFGGAVAASGADRAFQVGSRAAAR